MLLALLESCLLIYFSLFVRVTYILVISCYFLRVSIFPSSRYPWLLLFCFFIRIPVPFTIIFPFIYFKSYCRCRDCQNGLKGCVYIESFCPHFTWTGHTKKKKTKTCRRFHRWYNTVWKLFKSFDTTKKHNCFQYVFRQSSELLRISNHLWVFIRL